MFAGRPLFLLGTALEDPIVQTSINFVLAGKLFKTRFFLEKVSRTHKYFSLYNDNMGLDDFSETDIENYVCEDRIRRNLDDFFKLDEENDIHSVNRTSEGLGGPKTFARLLSERATDFAKEDVFILLGEEDGDLNVVAYDDGDVSLRKESGHWENYEDILGAHGIEFDKQPDVTLEMPDIFQRDEYSIDLGPESQEYIKTRDGGVIGPLTEEHHDEYGEFEQDWNY